MNPTDDIKWLLGILLVLFIGWYLLGGPTSPEADDGPFIRPLNPVGSGQVYGPHSPRVSIPDTWQHAETELFTARIPESWIHRPITTTPPDISGEFRTTKHVLRYEIGEAITVPVLAPEVAEKIRIDGTVGTFFTTTQETGTRGIYVNPRRLPPFAVYGYDLPDTYDQYLKQIGASIEFHNYPTRE